MLGSFDRENKVEQKAVTQNRQMMLLCHTSCLIDIAFTAVQYECFILLDVCCLLSSLFMFPPPLLHMSRQSEEFVCIYLLFLVSLSTFWFLLAAFSSTVRAITVAL